MDTYISTADNEYLKISIKLAGIIILTVSISLLCAVRLLLLKCIGVSFSMVRQLQQIYMFFVSVHCV